MDVIVSLFERLKDAEKRAKKRQYIADGTPKGQKGHGKPSYAWLWYSRSLRRTATQALATYGRLVGESHAL